MRLQSPTPEQILTESIVFYSIGVLLFVSRLWSRAILRQSWRKLQSDDYMMIATFCCYTILLVLLQFSSRYASNEFPPEQLSSILADPQEISDRIIGSKIVVGTNQCYLLTLWGVKATLLTLYNRMSRESHKNKTFVNIVIGYTVLGLLFIEIPYFFILCRPFSQYWAVPVSNPQCATYFYYCIIQMVFNVSSDILMLIIPLPFIIQARVTRAKRAMLAVIFSLGVFVILAAILSKAYNFANPHVTVYMLWNIRETSTAVYVANIMCIWPLLRRIFGLKSFIRVKYHSKGSRDSGPAPILTIGVPMQDIDVEDDADTLHLSPGYDKKRMSTFD